MMQRQRDRDSARSEPEDIIPETDEDEKATVELSEQDSQFVVDVSCADAQQAPSRMYVPEHMPCMMLRDDDNTSAPANAEVRLPPLTPGFLASKADNMARTFVPEGFRRITRGKDKETVAQFLERVRRSDPRALRHLHAFLAFHEVTRPMGHSAGFVGAHFSRRKKVGPDNKVIERDQREPHNDPEALMNVGRLCALLRFHPPRYDVRAAPQLQRMVVTFLRWEHELMRLRRQECSDVGNAAVDDDDDNNNNKNKNKNKRQRTTLPTLRNYRPITIDLPGCRVRLRARQGEEELTVPPLRIGVNPGTAPMQLCAWTPRAQARCPRMAQARVEQLEHDVNVAIPRMLAENDEVMGIVDRFLKTKEHLPDDAEVVGGHTAMRRAIGGDREMHAKNLQAQEDNRRALEERRRQLETAKQEATEDVVPHVFTKACLASVDEFGRVCRGDSKVARAVERLLVVMAGAGDGGEDEGVSLLQQLGSAAGKCLCCGAALRAGDSIDKAMGPVCWRRMRALLGKEPVPGVREEAQRLRHEFECRVGLPAVLNSPLACLAREVRTLAPELFEASGAEVWTCMAELLRATEEEKEQQQTSNNTVATSSTSTTTTAECLSATVTDLVAQGLRLPAEAVRAACHDVALFVTSSRAVAAPASDLVFFQEKNRKGERCMRARRVGRDVPATVYPSTPARVREALRVADFLGLPDAMFATPVAAEIRKADVRIEAGRDPLHRMN